MAGNSVTEYSQAAVIPVAVMLPRCQYGGASEKFRARKPTTVVNDVIVTARKLTRIDSISASALLRPSRICVRMDRMMCMESATASVRITIGADIDIGVSSTPANPAAPMAMIDDRMITVSVASVAEKERTISQVNAKMTTNISGISVAPSCMPVSAKALLSIETPVRCTWISG